MTPVNATQGKLTEPPCYIKNDRWFGPPGYMIKIDGGVAQFNIACPQCGEIGGPNHGAIWSVINGDPDDVTTLTLEPSIQKSCCGWHGYLHNGQFVIERPKT